MVVSGGITELTDTVTASYTSTLTVTGRETGSYSCVVTNSRSSATSQMLLLQGEYRILYLSLSYKPGLSINSTLLILLEFQCCKY